MNKIVSNSKKFSLTNIQKAYYMGRNPNFELGGVPTYVYYEFESNLKHKDFERSLNNLVANQPMLRASIDSLQEQTIIDVEDYPYSTVPFYDLTGLTPQEQRERILEVREEFQQKILSKEYTFMFSLAQLTDSTSYIFCYADMLIADAFSLGILLDELKKGCDVNDTVTTLQDDFSKYVELKESQKSSKRYATDKEYWLNRVDEIPPAPNVPTKSVGIECIPTTKRLSCRLDPKVWERIKEVSKVKDVPPTTAILTAYAMVLGFWSNQDNFTINMPISDRPVSRKGKGLDLTKVIGDFTSVMLIELEHLNSYNNDFWNYAESVKNSILRSFKHRMFDGTEIIREVAKINNAGDKALMPYVFTSMLLGEDTFDSITNFGDVKYSFSQTPQVFIDCQAMERDGSLFVTWDYVTQLFDEYAINYMFDKFIGVLNSITEEGSIPEEFYSLPPHDIEVLKDYNDTKEDIPVTNLNRLLKDNYTKYADKVAVKDDATTLTFGQLDILSNEVANILSEQGVSLGDCVGICTERNVYTIVNMLGVLKCGATYVTINADYPTERVNYILKKSNCKQYINKSIIDTVSLSDCRPFEPVDVPCTNIAYIIFTSGSTGEPKGVAITHQGVCNTVIDVNQKWNVNSNDKIICVTSFCFDLSVYDIFGALSSGAELVIVPEVRDIRNVLETLRNEHITIFNSVPAIMNLLVSECGLIKDYEPIHSLRLCLMSGDWIPTTLPKEIETRFPNCKPISLGGATEGSIWSIYHPIVARDSSLSSIPYGRPLANQTMYILSNDLRQCPLNTVGEIHIGGIGVADCYINDEEKTKASYVETKEFGRLYKTGDFGRVCSNGDMEFLGRRDFQVKINGHRIELSEIENVLNKYKDISNVVVSVVKNGLNVDSICAFYVSPTEYTEEELTEYVSKYVINYMIPKYYVKVDSIPLTSNGKVNRKALVLPKEYMTTTTTAEEDTSNLTPTERTLWTIWKKFLKTDSLNINSGFFNLGGDSVNMIQVIGEINSTFGVDIPFQKFLQNSSIKDVAMMIDKDKSTNDDIDEVDTFKIRPEDKWKPFKLSGLQESYFIGRNSEDYNGLATNGYVELDCADYDHEKFCRVLQRLIDRHDMLRCAIYPDGTQQFLKEAKVPEIPITDKSNLTADELEQYILETRREMTTIRLDLEKPPLIAIRVTMTGEKSAIVHVYVDGLIIDGWSYQLFHLELEELYRDESVQYPPLQANYRDYICYKEHQKTTKKYQRDKQYWLDKIDTLPEAGTLPLLKPLKELDLIEGNQVKCGLSIDDWHLLEEKSKVFGVSPFTVIFTSFALTIARWNNAQRFMLNIPEFDRPQFHPDVNKIIGICSAFLLFVVENDPKETFLDLVVKNHEQLWELKEHNSFSGMEVLREIYKEIKNYDTALVPIVFGMMANVKLPENQSISVRYQENHTTQIWIDITTTLYNDCIEFNWNSISGLMDYDMLSRMVEIQKDILHHAIYEDDFWETPCNVSLSDYDKNIVDAINDTDTPFEYTCFAKLFQDSSNKYSDRVFLCDENRSYTYSQVMQYVSNLSKRLLSIGCKPKDYISIYSEKSIEQIVSILAVDYIGAVYVPIEHNYSNELVLKCMNNVQSEYLITNKDTTYFTDNGIVTILDSLIEDDSEVLSPTIVDDTSLIALINTSGSTGLPKSVKVTQKGLLNSIQYTNSRFNVTDSDVFIGLTNYAHDMSMYDIFGSMYSGATLVIPVENKCKDPQHWEELIQKYGVTIWNSVPAIIQMMLEHNKGSVPNCMKSIRLMFSGGDYLKVKLAQTLKDSIDGLQLINVGGPTETTLWNICHEVTTQDIATKTIPYGRPIANTKYYILNENRQICPIGVVGMMHCAGVGISKGYVNNPVENLKKFSIWEQTGELIYNTGDLGKYDEHGNIIFMGRNDLQVEINGKRIELNGISEVLCQHKDIEDCAVKLTDDGSNIVAYYTSYIDVDTKAINDYMNQNLPYFEVPKFYVRVDTIPLTNNGKVDYKALPSYNTSAEENTSTNTANAQPRDELEQTLVDVYSEMLGVQADVSTDFFTMGGNSLMAIKMVSKIREEFNIPISLTEMFSTSTISELYELIRYKLDQKEEQ